MSSWHVDVILKEKKAMTRSRNMEAFQKGINSVIRRKVGDKTLNQTIHTRKTLNQTYKFKTSSKKGSNIPLVLKTENAHPINT
jgi:hypothetical protein